MQMTSISPDSRGGTIHGLQALRMIAATMVVFTHALNRGADAFPNGGIARQQFLESGVDIFFVISGFIMVYILKPDSKPLAFWLQRFTRIAPLYWAATAFAVFLGYVAPRYGFGGKAKRRRAMSSMCSPPISWCRAICAMSACISATCSAP